MYIEPVRIRAPVARYKSILCGPVRALEPPPMDDSSDAESATQMPQDSVADDPETRVKGEKASAWAHLVFALVFLLLVGIVIGYSNTYNLSKNLNFIAIYNYKKSLPDKSGAVNTIQTYISDSTKGAWINDAASKCRDLQVYWWPTAGFNVASTPIVANACDFKINLQLGPMEGQVKLRGDVTWVSRTTCTTNTAYNVVLTLPSGSDGTLTTPSITATITGTTGAYIVTFSDPNVVWGYNFGVLNGNFQTCLTSRQNLADTIHNATECQAGFSSPLCTCVRAFTARLTSWQSRLVTASSGGLKYGDVLVKGVQRCTDLRRSHDIRERTSYVYVHSTALVVFAVALVCNGIFNLLSLFEYTSQLLQNSMYYGFFFLLYGLAVFLPSLLISNGSGTAELETTFAMVFPAFFVHGAYLAMLRPAMRMMSVEEKKSYEIPFLHPVTFDICLCALTLFTLVERGVVQTEYLVAEVLKCHAVAGVYIALMYYHCYGRRNAALDSEGVQQAYLILYVVGLFASVSSLVVPYALRQNFEFHWLLPGVLTYVAYANTGWSVSLPMAAKLRNARGASLVVYNFNAVAGFLVLFVGAIFLSKFLTVYLQIYGAKNFTWPVQGDPLSYALVRKLLLPTGTTSDLRVITSVAI